ncbi:MAG: glycosyltransferase family 39 protein [Pirellula sp.]|nr:glycosyltransferase family 39 protein [Pirellula sp.]
MLRSKLLSFSSLLRVPRSTFRDVSILVVLAAIVLLLNLGNSRFWDQDEGYYASVASEMYRRGDWVVPTFNEHLFAHKPPMMYWGMLLGFSSLGVSELAARLPSALFGLGCTLLVYFLGRRLFDRNTGLIAGLVLGSSLMFTVVSRSATADAHLTFFVTLALFLWVRDAFPNRDVPLEQDSTRLSIRLGTWVGIYSAIALAVLSKGPIGLAFPITILAGVHILEPWLRSWAQSDRATASDAIRSAWSFMNPWSITKTLWSMRPITGIAVVLAIAGPWFMAMQWKTDGAFLSEFLGVHHLNRFSQAMDNHSGPFYYYVVACLVGLYPWSAFAIPTAISWLSPNVRTKSLRAWLLTSLWIVVYLGVFSIASTKLPNYVIPAYPAFAIVIGRYISRWNWQPDVAGWRWQTAGWSFMIAVGVVVLAAPWLMTTTLGNLNLVDRLQMDPSLGRTIRWISLLSIPLVIGGLYGLRLRFRDRNKELGPCFALTATVMMVLFWQVLVPLADRHQTPQDIATALPKTDRASSDPPSFAVLQYFRPSMVFYAGNAIEFCKDETSLAERLSKTPAPIIVLKEDSLDQVRSQLPTGYRIVHMYPEFPHRGNVLVLEPPLQR